MIASSLQRILQAPKDSLAVMLNLRCLAVQRTRMRDASAVGQVHGLMSQTDAEDWSVVEVLYDLQTAPDVPRVGRMAGSRRYDYSQRFHGSYLRQRYPVGL